jgi:hypothetical protein
LSTTVGAPAGTAGGSVLRARVVGAGDAVVDRRVGDGVGAGEEVVGALVAGAGELVGAAIGEDTEPCPPVAQPDSVASAASTATARIIRTRPTIARLVARLAVRRAGYAGAAVGRRVRGTWRNVAGSSAVSRTWRS